MNLYELNQPRYRLVQQVMKGDAISGFFDFQIDKVRLSGEFNANELRVLVRALEQYDQKTLEEAGLK